MVFSSAVFIFVFLPIVLFCYYMTPEKYRNALLLVFSLMFYAYGEPKFIIVLIISVLCNYALAICMDQSRQHKKIIMVVTVIMNLGILFVFKYLGFSVDIFNKMIGSDYEGIKILLPIGLSFFTFKSLSYVIDVYRGDVKVERNVLNFGLYISLFPQLTAGPISRYKTIAAQLTYRPILAEKIGEGARRFMLGLCKKVLLANNLSVVSEHYFSLPATELTVIGSWLGAISFSLQIFYDFSGYSDMAIGLGKMFGFEFEENFNYPYQASTIQDFWRRWHISLSQWFRDYVYIPLGGSRVKPFRHIVNLAVVWVLTGIWHGANDTFIIWGFMYFIALAFERKCIRPEDRSGMFQVVYRVLTLLYINFAWVIFHAKDLSGGLRYWMAMLGANVRLGLVDSSTISFFKEYAAFLILGLLFATPIASMIRQKGSNKTGIMFKVAIPVLYLGAFLWAISFLVLGAHNPFIYFDF